MHAISFFPARSRSLPAHALCAGAVCFALLFPFPALAGGKPAPDNEAAALSRQTPAYGSLVEPIAGNIRVRAEHAAKLAPRLGAVAALYANAAGIPGRAIDGITDSLWTLRGEPELQQARLAAILTVKTEDEAKQAYRDLLTFLADVKRLALKLDGSDTVRQFAERRAELRNARTKEGKTPSSAQAISLRLDEDAAFTAALVPALRIAARLDAASLRALVADDAAISTLRALADRPDDFTLAAGIFGNANLTEPQKRVLAAELATSPETAREKITSLKKNEAVQRAYIFAMHKESRGDIIGLPLTEVIPDIPFALERAENIPLAASPVRQPQKALTFARLERLTPLDAAKEKDSKTALPILKPGERLYTLSLHSGTPVFRNGPLSALAYAGPQLTELTEETAKDFLALLGDANRAWDRSYFIATPAGPEELAAHLTSLAVVRSAREKSLYGPFADYLWRPGKNDQPSYANPKDSMGETLRLADIRDADLFFSLAPLADEQGLARLMGPIRGIWAKHPLDGKGSWVEMRYDPRKKSLGKGHKLEDAHVLSLDETALRAIIRGKERQLVHEWAVFTLGAKCRDNSVFSKECAEALPAALEKTQKTFDSLRLLGFTAPRDKGTVVYFLERYAKDPAMRDRLADIINDTRRSPAQRILALQQAAAEK